MNIIKIRKRMHLSIFGTDEKNNAYNVWINNLNTVLNLPQYWREIDKSSIYREHDKYYLNR